MPALGKFLAQQVVQVIGLDIVPLAEVVAGRQHRARRRPAGPVGSLSQIDLSASSARPCRVEPRTRPVGEVRQNRHRVGDARRLLVVDLRRRRRRGILEVHRLDLAGGDDRAGKPSQLCAMANLRRLISSRCRVDVIFLDHQAVLVFGVGEELLEVVAFARHEDGVFADRVILVLLGDLFPEDLLGLFVFLLLHQVFALVVGGHRLGRIDEVDLFLLFVGLGQVRTTSGSVPSDPARRPCWSSVEFAASSLACRADASIPVLHPARTAQKTAGHASAQALPAAHFPRRRRTGRQIVIRDCF